MLVEDTIRMLEASLSPAVCGEVYQKRVEIDEYKANQLAKAAAFRPTDVNSPTYTLDVVLYEQAVSSVAVSVANFESSLWQNNPHLYDAHVRLMEIDRLKAELGEAGPVRAQINLASAPSFHTMKSFSMGRQGSAHLPPLAALNSTQHSLLSSQSLNSSTQSPEAKLATEPGTSALGNWQSSSLYVDNLRNRHFSQYLPHGLEDNRSDMSTGSDATNWTMNSQHSSSTQMSHDGRTSPALQTYRSQTLDAVPEMGAEQDFCRTGSSSWLLSTVNTTTMDMLNNADQVMALYKSLDPQSRQELTQLLQESLKLKAAQIPATPTLPQLTDFTSSLSEDIPALSARVQALTVDKPSVSEKADAVVGTSQIETDLNREAATSVAQVTTAKGHTPVHTDKQKQLERPSSSSMASDGSSQKGHSTKKKKSFGKKLLNGIVAIWDMGDSMWDESVKANVRG